MSITTTSSGGGTDWEKYILLSEVGNPTLDINYSPLIDIQGQGYLSRANIYNSGSLIDNFLKITVDGIVIHETYGTGNVTGMLSFNEFSMDNGSLYVRAPKYSTLETTSPSPLSYPSINGEYGIVLLNKPIFFNYSLLIEGKTSETRGCYYEILGGVI